MKLKDEFERFNRFVGRQEEKIDKVEDYVEEHAEQARKKLSKIRRLLDFLKNLFGGA